MRIRITNDRVRRNLIITLRAVSLGLLLKGAVGGSLAALALFGVAVPILGIEATPVGESVATMAGAILGVLAAFRA